MPLHLSGAVAFTVDGPGGSTAGTVEGEGAVLRVQADDPVAAWSGQDTGALGRVAEALHAQGLSVEVTGPGGRLATVGAGADSALGRLLTGSRRVAPGRPAALRPLVLAEGRRRVRTVRGPLLLAVAAVAVLVVRRRR